MLGSLPVCSVEFRSKSVLFTFGVVIGESQVHSTFMCRVKEAQPHVGRTTPQPRRVISSIGDHVLRQMLFELGKAVSRPPKHEPADLREDLIV